MNEELFLKQLARKINSLMLLTQITHSSKASKELLNNLTHSQVLFLQFVKMLGTINISNLSKILRVAPSFTSRLTSQLEDGNYLKRIHKPKLRKEVFVELTIKGKRIVDKIEEFDASRRIKLLKYINQDLGVDKTKVLEEVVDHLSNKIQERINKIDQKLFVKKQG